MSKNKNKKKISSSSSAYPFVSICTPTFNRRPFYDMLIRCFHSQTYPKDRMEWIIIDDGTDKIEDLVKDIPQVKYFKYDTQMKLGQKRNLMHEKSVGEIIIYMDDDDYYPPQRVSHAVEKLQENPNIMIAGSSKMYIYFKHIKQMYQFGPYGTYHSTAATFAFRRELLKITSYDNNAALAEEKHFLKGYTIPLIQLDPLKTILVFSHIHNSFDKKELLNQPESKFMNKSNILISDFIQDDIIIDFFVEKIDNILQKYEPGKLEYKPEVIKQISETRDKKYMMNQQQMAEQIHHIMESFRQIQKISEQQNQLIQILMRDNVEMKKRISILENNINK